MTVESSRPFSPEKAVQIAESQVGHAVYQLGTGDSTDKPDDPTDCAGFAISRCYGLRRHRPGFNRGDWASVSDDLNSNSAIEDAEHHMELFLPVWADMGSKQSYSSFDVPESGDLIAYPTFRLPGHPQHWIGHVAIVTAVPPEWDWTCSRWRDLTIVQCCGPNGRRPGINKTGGGHFDVHDQMWPKPEHRTRLIRVRQDAKEG